MPFHTHPIGTFWNEWWASALGLAATVTGLFAARDRLRLPPLLIIPALLTTILLLQFVFGRLVFPQIGLLYAVYLLWAGLLLVLGRHLAETIGLARLADVLALAFVIGAMVGMAAAMVQWLGVANRVPWIFPVGGNCGNLGQCNHHAHFSWLGIASAFYLRGRERLSRGLLWLLILLIGFGSVLSGSRSVFIYSLVLLATLTWARHRDADGRASRLMVDAFLLLPVLVGLNFLGAWVSPWIQEFWAWLGVTVSTSGAAMPGDRLFDQVSGPSIRLAIMSTAWAAFAEHPWLGQGVGNYIWASFVAASGHAGGEPLVVAEHAHNLVFQLLAEFGAPAALAVILLLAFWARQFFRQQWTMAHVWCATVLGMGAVHSLLEYPLWYSYFLGPTALLLGATDSTKGVTLAGRRITVYLLLGALAFTVILGNLRSDYSKIEAITYQPLSAHPDRELAWRISMNRLFQLHDESLLSPWALLAFATMAEPSRHQANDRARLCERGIRFAPVRSLVARCAMQQAIAGRDQEALQLILNVLRAYPSQRATTIDELAKGAREYPEILPVWQASLSK